MQDKITRLLVVVTLLVGVSVLAVVAPPSATVSGAAGVNEFSPAQWWPLRGSNLIGCTTGSGGPVCGGHHAVNAIDIEGPEGQAVYAAGAGLATVYSTSTGCSGYGKAVVVDHGPHGKTIYAHLSGFSAALNASPGGVWVDENTVIGSVGHTGSVSNCSYNHLHFEYTATGSWGSGASRIPGLKGCVGDTLRTYPDVFGQSSWVGLTGHTFTATNDGTGCLNAGKPIGAIDLATGSLGGFVDVSGWAIDPDVPATATQVHVYVDGPAGSGAPGFALDANQPRPDVVGVRPGAGPLHGYRDTIAGIAPGAHTLWIYAINAPGTRGDHTVLGTPVVTVPAPTPGRPIGSVDLATGLSGGRVQVAGWAFDPDVPTAVSQVHVYVDGAAGSGAPGFAVDADQPRADIANAYPSAGPSHGFDSTFAGIAPGSHTLWIYAINLAGPTENPLLGTPTVTVPYEGPACGVGSPAGPFVDVGPPHPFCSDIEWMQQAGIDGGYPDGTFAPMDANTREMLAVQLYRFVTPPAFTPPSTSPFTDVAVTDPHFTAIAWLASTGLTTGYDDGTFRPASPVSRQAMAAFFYRMARLPSAPAATATTAAPFIDVGADHHFAAEIAWLASTGITTGYDDGSFQPSSMISRQAMAAFLHRYASL